jgi:methionine salvage enolase-phosphatase E1
MFLIVGHKRESKSYSEIALSLGADPSDCLFATDVFEEAQAAEGAGNISFFSNFFCIENVLMLFPCCV